MHDAAGHFAGCNRIYNYPTAASRTLRQRGTFASRRTSETLEPTVVSDDARLIEATLAGDREAFGLLVERHQDRLYNALYRFLGSAEDARDVAQDTFLQAMTRLRSFRGDSAFYTWLYRIGFNLAMSHRRRAKPMASIDRLHQAVGAEPSDNGASPESPILAAERIEMVQSAINRLPDDQRQVVVLREIEECSYEQIAEILDVPLGTVRSRLFRARLLLKEYLEQMLQEDVKELGQSVSK